MISVTSEGIGKPIEDITNLRLSKIRAGMLRAAAVYHEIQNTRTRQGLDVHGIPFDSYAPYSPGYGKLKAEGGRTGSGEWLRLTGGMFRSRKYMITGDDKIKCITFYFSGAYSSGKFEKNKRGKVVVHRGPQVQASFIATVNNEKRPFVGLRPSELETLRRVIFQS